MISSTGRIAYEFRSPLGPGLHGLADALATDTPGWWETKWSEAVDQFRSIWTSFAASKDTLATAGYALDSMDATQVDVAQLEDLRRRAADLDAEQSSIDYIVQEAIAKIHAVEDRLGWSQTQLGIIGIDDAALVAIVVTAGVAAVGYYVYKITVHTQDVNQLSSELQALGKGVLTPAQLVQLHQTQQASTPGSGIVSEILSQVLPYVGVGVAGWLLWRAFKGKLT